MPNILHTLRHAHYVRYWDLASHHARRVVYVVQCAYAYMPNILHGLDAYHTHTTHVVVYVVVVEGRQRTARRAYRGAWCAYLSSVHHTRGVWWWRVVVRALASVYQCTRGAWWGVCIRGRGTCTWWWREGARHAYVVYSGHHHAPRGGTHVVCGGE